MNQALLDKIHGEQLRKEAAVFNVGDSVKVHTKVVEGDKERIQIFSGVVIGKRGRGLEETFTVRRISYGEGVERVFPVNSPNIEKIEVERESEAMKARLYYLRDRTGKAAVAIKEKDRAAEIHAQNEAAKAAAQAAPAAAAAPAADTAAPDPV